MRTYTDNFAPLETASEKQPHFVYQQSWDFADTDHTYFTSSTDADTPAASDTIDSVFLSVSGQTQKINPDIATSTIGSITIRLVDVGEAVNDKIALKRAAGYGMRGKIGRLYVGYLGLPFADYDLRVTYVVDSVSYKDGIYTITLSDLQRTTKQNIFTPHETTLNQTVTAESTLIPCTQSDLTKFPAFEHGSDYTVRPGETVSYIKLEDEVICHSGLVNDATLGPSFQVIERGALNTRAVVHEVDTTKPDNRKPKIVEHIYIEGAAPKVIYALLTGEVANQTGDMPVHWHLGISTSMVRLTDFESLGPDYWDSSTDAGRFVRIENPKPQDGKRYIEKELLLWLGAFMPIYSDGSIGIRRLSRVLADSGYVARLGAYNIVSYGDLQHDMNAVINNIQVEWNWVDAKQEYTKKTVLIDADSNAIHGDADARTFKFKTVHTGLHTDDDILTYLDVLRDRYSGPPLRLQVTVLPSLAALEVGDTVLLDLPHIRDMNTGSTISRTFEVQQVSTDWMTGDIKLDLFGSSQQAGQLVRTSLSSVLLDSFYTSEGTDLASVLTISAGAVTTNGTITGHATNISNSAAIFYYDGDLTINAGVTVTIANNVQLRIKGSLQVNGDINGIGGGAAGGVATTQFLGGGTSDSFDWFASDFLRPFDIDTGVDAYFGMPMSGMAFYFNALSSGSMLCSSTISINGSQGDPRRTKGSVSAVPFFDIRNISGSSIAGLPVDLRGHGGMGGIPAAGADTGSLYSGTAYVLASGAAGGDGGAGLMVIARGMAFGGAGFIDLSGGNSGTPGTVSSSGKTFYGGHGAPGAPGAFLLLLDGNATNPDIDSNTFIANYGSMPTLAATDVEGPNQTTTWPTSYAVGCGPYLTNYWPYTSAELNLGASASTSGVSVSASAHRLQYVPPVADVAQEPDRPDSISDLRLVPKLEHSIDLVNDYSADMNNMSAVSFSDDNARMLISARVTGDTALVLTKTNAWTEEQALKPATATSNYGSGSKISGNGLRAVIADFSYASPGAGAGAFYVYGRSGTTWSQEGGVLQGSDAAANDSLGTDGALDISYDGDHIMIGTVASPYPTFTGKAYYFERVSGTWTQRQIINGNTANEFFCRSLAMTNDAMHCAIGAPAYDLPGTDCGAVYVYDRSGTTWTLSATLTISDAMYALNPSNWILGSTHGLAISDDGNTIAASANNGIDGAANLGSIVIFKKNAGKWSIQQLIGLNPDIAKTGDQFGARVSLNSNGSILLVGSRGVDYDSGSTAYTAAGRGYIYTNVSGRWVLDSEIIPPAPDTNVNFGDRVSISNDGSYMFISSKESASVYSPVYQLRV